MQADFGPANFVEADGWFSLETGPWLASGPPATEASTAAAAVLSPDRAGEALQEDDYGDCLNGFKVPAEEGTKQRARAVFESLTHGNPNATWLYQGYPWFRVYSQGKSCNQTALREFIRGFTAAVPKDRLLVLDLIADSPGRALWRYPESPTLGPFTQNASLIWCALNNWGGAVHLGGDLSYVLSETRAAMATPNVVGVGLTPEGIDNSAAYFSLVLDSPWTEEPTAQSWYREWGHGRCGKAGVAAAEEAYDLLFQTVYRPGQPYLWCCSQPVFCPTATPKGTVARPAYNTTLLRRALELMVEASASCNTPTFLYDLVDVAREWLSMAPCLDRFDKVNTRASPAELQAQVAALLEVAYDVDTMMATNDGFLLGAWLNSSRSVADWDGSNGALADFYEQNSRMQITTWAGGYSRREWSGVVREYYGGRTSIWLNFTLKTMQEQHRVPSWYALEDKASRHSVGSTPTGTDSGGGGGTPGGGGGAGAGSTRTGTNRGVGHGGDGGEDGGYTPHVGMDCNFQDLRTVGCKGKAEPQCLADLEHACDADKACVGFNYPGGILKRGCSDWEASPRSTMYLQHGFIPSGARSSCVHGVCHANVANGTYAGTSCANKCGSPKPHPHPAGSLAALYAAFADKWINTTWDARELPAEPQGDPVAMAKRFLAKYPM